MSLRSEIPAFTDNSGLVAPYPVVGELKTFPRASDNGPMFTSEYYVLLALRKELLPSDVPAFYTTIVRCISNNGLLNRAPIYQKTHQEGPDDYYAVLNACKHLGITDIPTYFLKAVLYYQGFLNNENPGVKTAKSFLIRQPQLLAAMISAAFPSKFNPLHWIIRLAAFPLYLIAAIVIATSCINTPLEDTDARRLAWHLIKNVEQTSLLCFLASHIWFNRLYAQYSGEYNLSPVPNRDCAMRAVARRYYSTFHPFASYWVD